MKLDAHVHTRHSGRTALHPLSLIMRESDNRPEQVYRLAEARGMDLVAITDHDATWGAAPRATCQATDTVRVDALLAAEQEGVSA